MVLRIGDHYGKRQAAQQQLQLGAHGGQIGHVMGHAHCAHDPSVIVEKRRLPGFELAHALFALDEFVKNAGLALFHDHGVCFQTHILALFVFFLLQIPDIIMAPPLNIIFAFAHGPAKTVVDLEMRARRVLEPDQGGRGVDDRIQIVVREAGIPLQLQAVKQPSETGGKRRRAARPGPEIVDMVPDAVRQPGGFRRIRGQKDDARVRFGRAAYFGQAGNLPGLQKNDVVLFQITAVRTGAAADEDMLEALTRRHGTQNIFQLRISAANSDP